MICGKLQLPSHASRPGGWKRISTFIGEEYNIVTCWLVTWSRLRDIPRRYQDMLKLGGVSSPTASSYRDKRAVRHQAYQEQVTHSSASMTPLPPTFDK